MVNCNPGRLHGTLWPHPTRDLHHTLRILKTTQEKPWKPKTNPKTKKKLRINLIMAMPRCSEHSWRSPNPGKWSILLHQRSFRIALPPVGLVPFWGGDHSLEQPELVMKFLTVLGALWAMLVLQGLFELTVLTTCGLELNNRQRGSRLSRPLSHIRFVLVDARQGEIGPHG